MSSVSKPSPAMNADRTSRPTAVLTGMFCRFGSFDEMRPVAGLLPQSWDGSGDHSLSQLRIGLVEEHGDQATVRIHYPLAGTEIDTTVSLTRRDGHWYLDDYLEHAATLLRQSPDGDGDGDGDPSLPPPGLPGLPTPSTTAPPTQPAAGR